jgi:basic membrane protein A and related proteins
VRKRWFALALVALVVAFAIIGAAVRGSEASAKRQALGACLVTDIGGLNDKSFNHLAYVGLQRAQKQLGITGRVIQSKSPADYIPNLSTCVRQGSAVTIGVGFLMTDAMDAVSSKFPRNKFAIVDVNVEDLKHKGKNVQGLLFKEQEAGYLAGVAAGLWAKGHPLNGGPAVVGSVGGIKIPPVDRYIAGYQYGAKQADPQVKVLNDYSQDFVAQAKCKEKALNEIANGAAVVFQVAGQCGLGALDAAKGYLGTQVMTSALKRVDVAVFKAIQATKGGGLKTGINAIFGAKENGIGVGKFSPQVPASIKKTVANKLVLLKQGKIPGIPTTVK